jgi:hypothetical protein
MKKIFFLMMLAFSASTYAQQSALTFFAQEGELFYIILDGIRQNTEASAHVKITDLERPNYRVKVIFDDAEIKDINKNIFVQDVDNKSIHSVYMIARNKKGEMDIKLSSFNEVQETKKSTKENTVKYHDYELASQNVSNSPNKSSSKTENYEENISVNTAGVGTSMKVNQSGDNVNVSLQIDGIKDLMNMDVNASQTSTRSTQSTTTTQQKQNAEPKAIATPPSENTSNVAKKCVYAMSNSEFEKGKSAVAKQSFAESMLKTAKQMTRSNCLSVNQIKAIMALFSFEESKLDYAKYAYEYCVEKKNYYLLNDAFSFSTSSDSLNDFLESQAH